jgi:2-amino-4-hydroxy-6-hydroxymethyldihydropteridine diphosphokinase
VLLLLGLGGNLAGTPEALLGAIHHLELHAELRAVSRVWRTPAMGPPQGEYLNAAAVVEVQTHPLVVLQLCQRLEALAGRDRRREQRWGPRVLDLDLLLAPGVVLQHPDLLLPHPALHQRAFALAPGCEVAADWQHPRLFVTLAELLRRVDTTGCSPVQLPGWPG